MGVSGFIRTIRSWLADEGPLGLVYIFNQVWMGVLRRLSPLFDGGTNIYEREWDVLLVLDACRVDALAEVADDYAFLDTPGTHRSTASTSIEWMETTFVDEYEPDIKQTVYVTANQHSESVSDLPFLAFEEVYDYGWDDDAGTVPADVVTDVAIKTGREYEERDRMIVHYMQPHFPSIPRPLGHGNKYDNVWKGLMIGRGNKEELWKSYIANLRYVLDEVGDLLENVDADRVAITADHGNGMGE